MGVQVSCGIHTEVPEEDRLLGDAGGYPRYHPGLMQVERGGNYRRESDARPYPSAAVDSTEVFRVKFYGVSGGEKCNDDIRATRKFKV